MQLLKRFLISAFLLSLLLGGFSTTVLAQAEDTPSIRFMHAIPAASPIDIYTDNQLTISGLSFGEASNYIAVPAGNHTLVVTPTGLTTTLWQQSITINPGQAQTLIAATTEPLGFLTYQQDLVALALGNTRLRVVYAVPDGPTIDIMQSSGDRIITNLEAGQSFGDFDVAANVYELAVVPAGEEIANALVATQSYALQGNTSYLLVIYGVGNNPSTTLLAAPTQADEEGGLVRLAHGVADAPPVDIYLNDILIAPSLAFGEVTNHLALPTGDYNASVRANGEELVAANLSIQAGGMGTVVVLGTTDDLTVDLFPDDTSMVTEDKAVLSLINTIPGNSSVSVSLEDGTVIAGEVAFGQAGTASIIEPSTQAAEATITLDGESGTIELPETTFYGGVYYNVIALTGTAFMPPSVIFAPTSVIQSITSAPGAAMISADTTDVADTTVEDTSQAALPTIPPTPAPEAVAPTAEPTQPPAPVEAVTTVVEGPTARVLLNPDANLQLRQYPRADALSLGGAPSGSTLAVNGREGAPVYTEGTEPEQPAPETTPEVGSISNASGFVDPATLLDPNDEKADLVPEETWLNVVYTTPDGGTITAWINALYVELRDEDGDLMRLADLDMVPNNRYGEAKNTAITPPPIPKDRVTAIVFNLNPDAQLNIRRTPTTQGERLGGVSNGTVLEFLGLGESEDWAYIRYLPAEGGSITGWVSTQFIEYEYNGRQVDLEELDQRELLEMIEDDPDDFNDRYRGAVSGGAEVAPVPTKDPIKDAYVGEPVVDQGANLNLRRTANQDGEVIGKIPAGTQLIISGRDGDWLQTEFEGETGWVAKQYLEITFNGKLVEDISEIPSVSGEEEDED